MADDPEQRLGDERTAAIARFADLAEELRGIIEAADAAPPDDEHDVEGSSIGFERARITALLAQAEQVVTTIDSALARLQAGDEVYGRCEVCSQPIGGDRLAALPAAQRCIDCAGIDRRDRRLRD